MLGSLNDARWAKGAAEEDSAELVPVSGEPDLPSRVDCGAPTPDSVFVTELMGAVWSRCRRGQGEADKVWRYLGRGTRTWQLMEMHACWVGSGQREASRELPGFPCNWVSVGYLTGIELKHSIELGSSYQHVRERHPERSRGDVCSKALHCNFLFL